MTHHFHIFKSSWVVRRSGLGVTVTGENDVLSDIHITKSELYDVSLEYTILRISQASYLLVIL